VTDVVALTTEQRALVAKAVPSLTRLGHSHLLGYPERLRPDLMQTILETASRAAIDFDPTRGASFVTFAWKRASFEAMKAASASFRDEKRLVLGRMTEAASDILTLATIPDQATLFANTDADQRRILDQLNDALGGAMTLSLLGPGTPECDAILKQDRERVRSTLDEIFASMEARDRDVITRRYARGESLQSIFGPGGEPTYKAGTKRLYAVVARIGNEFKKRGIGPSTARTVGELALDPPAP
jgi:hypothetical protein